MDSPVLQIVIFRDGTPVGTEVFLPGEYTVGSDDGCELVLSDARVAPAQAQLSFREGRIRLSDLGGPGGVTVNGQRLANGELRSRDDVAIGPFLLKFRVVGSKRPAAPSEPPAGPVPVPPAAPVRPAHPSRAGAAASAPTLTSPPVAQPASALPRKAVAADAVALAVAPQPSANRLESGVRPSTDFDVTSNVAVPASLLKAASLAAQLGRAPPAPAPAPAERPKAPQRLTVAPAPPDPPRSEPPQKAGPLPSNPSLRIRVFWGRSMVGIYGFPFGRKVMAGARDGVDVPLYGVTLPKRQFAFARVKDGKWAVRVPPGLTAYRFEKSGWKPATGEPDGRDEASLLSLDLGEVVRMGDARHSIEVRTDRIAGLPKATLRESVDPQLGIPFGIFSVLAIAAMIAMPQLRRDQPDFTPKQLAPVRALLKPPEKKKPPEEAKKPEEKKVEEKKPEEKVAKVEKAPDSPKPRQQAAANVKQAMKAVEKTAVAVQAVESLLKATSKLAGGPKGYGDKGMGYKISPLIGKPPIAQAGIGFGPGLGGFGAQTVGIGAMRGMGNGEGGGIGAFASGGVGHGKVGGAVISAPSRKAEVRGQLDRELIAKVINEHMGEIRGCYERALLKEAGLAGKLVLEWTIEPTGIVSDIRVKNVTLRGPEVPNCIIGSLRGWAFPKPKGGKVVVSYPFLFNSVGF